MGLALATTSVMQGKKTKAASNAKPARTTNAAPPRATQAGHASEGLGKAHATPPSKRDVRPPDDTATTGNAGSERALDEAREGGPRYGGGDWDVADERGELRYGHARNDDGETAQATSLDADAEPGERTDDPDLQLDEPTGDIEASGQHAGMGRGEKPRKTKSEER